MSKITVLLDRDGVINKDIGHLDSIKKIKFLKGVFQAFRFLKKKKIKVIIITNQSVVGRGIISSRKLKLIHNYINNCFKKKGGEIEKFYFCPFHPKYGKGYYKKKSLDRKPNPGMILKAKKKYNLDHKNCFMIGDNLTDQLAAKRAKVNFFFKKDQSLFTQIKSILKIYEI